VTAEIAQRVCLCAHEIARSLLGRFAARLPGQLSSRIHQLRDHFLKGLHFPASHDGRWNAIGLELAPYSYGIGRVLLAIHALAPIGFV